MQTPDSLLRTPRLYADLTPAQITADQHNYNPAGLSSSSVIRLDANRLWTITGLAGGMAGRVVTLVYVGTNGGLRLAHEDASSAAANRFDLGSDLYLFARDSVVLLYDGVAARWKPFSLALLTRMHDPLSRVVLFDDFTTGNVVSTLGWTAANGGTGASTQAGGYGVNATQKAIGVWELDTGTTATGRAAISLWTAGSTTQGMHPALGVCIVGWRVAVEVLSTATEEYIVRAGLMDIATTGEPTDGVYFEYDRLTAGDFWRICAAGGAVRTKTTTSQAVTTDYIWLLAIINAGWTSVDYFARPNNATAWTYLGTIADANIPAAGELMGPQAGIIKSVGTTQRDFDVDAFFMSYAVRR